MFYSVCIDSWETLHRYLINHSMVSIGNKIVHSNKRTLVITELVKKMKISGLFSGTLKIQMRLRKI